VFAPIPFNRNGAIVGILRIAFKAFFEYVREETFGKYGLQQIQLDCAFIAEMVRDFVENDDASVLDSLLDEVVASAQLRCVEPVAMDASVVEARCEEQKKKFSCMRKELHASMQHWWGNRFVDLCAAVVADALEESSYGLVSRLLQKDVDIIERILEKCGRLQDCYWICAFCVNQHASICDCNHHSRDSLTAQRYPVCDCGLPKQLGVLNSSPTLRTRSLPIWTGCLATTATLSRPGLPSQDFVVEGMLLDTFGVCSHGVLTVRRNTAD
ncbi:VPS51, partial [Symbiodinium necroappetens]